MRRNTGILLILPGGPAGDERRAPSGVAGKFRPEPGPCGPAAAGLGDARDGLLYVPEADHPDRPALLALMFHGALQQRPPRPGSPSRSLKYAPADPAGPRFARADLGMFLLGPTAPTLPSSTERSPRFFDRYAIDPAHVAVGGFPTALPTRFPWGSRMGIRSPTSSPSHRGSRPRSTRRACPASSSPTGPRTASSRLTSAAAASISCLRRAGPRGAIPRVQGGHSVPAGRLRGKRWSGLEVRV